MISRKGFAKTFMWTVIATGSLGLAYCTLRVRAAQLDMLFLPLAVCTVVIISRVTVRLPGVNGRVTMSETLIFLAMLFYGGEVAILFAAAAALCSSLIISRKPITLAYNTAMLALSTYLTVFVLRLLFGPIVNLTHDAFSTRFIMAISVMALVQFVGNSVLAAVAHALKYNKPVWQVYNTYCLWTSITYFAGASAAGIISRLTGVAGFYAVIAAAPIIAIVYLTYRTYLKNIEVMAAAAKTEAEAVAHTEAAAAQNEQAQLHIAELSHYIAEQDRIREQYSQVEKMSALGELASGVAHDFNNTLTGILGRAQLLLVTTDRAQLQSGLKTIIKTATDGARTIKRIQDFARQRRDHDFHPLSVDQLLRDVSDITRPRWKDHAEANNVHIKLSLQFQCTELVLGDESELREVLVNMVFNAIDAMPGGGTLTLATREVNEAIEISVGDTGTGMSDEVRSRIFDPFFTTKGAAGMGLGLAVSYGIIRRHDGNVEVESTTGQGTTFRITLPSAQGLVAPPAPLEAIVMKLPAGERSKILVVDDEDYVRELLRDILEHEGHEVVLAQGGREALALFEASTFAAIFTDVGLPGMSGWELARAIRERDCAVPLAVITGWGEAVGSLEQKTAAVDWVVAKPFTMEQILKIAGEVSQRRAPTAQQTLSAAAA
jgi:signal transduction histidine kinase/CheY-like chemotaxis protein